jgi:predicted O-linked N-acetylglucosamine transferase (SPINDLY family)
MPVDSAARAVMPPAGLPRHMSNGTPQINEIIQRADAAYAAGDWPVAERLCGLVLETHSNHVYALSLLGIIKARTGHADQAAVLLRQVAIAMPDNPVAHNNHANVLRDLGRLQEAVKNYDRALALDPGYAEAYYNRGDALLALKRPDAALESYVTAIRLRPDYAEAHYSRGIALHELGRVNEALESYARAIAIHPRFADAYYNQGIALHELRRWEEAARSYRGAIQIREGFAQAYNNLGTVLRDLGQTDGALDCFAKALTINPALGEAHLNLGQTLATLKRLEESLASYEQALRLMPDQPWLYGARLFAKMQLCDWAGMPALIEGMFLKVSARQPCVQPLIALALTDEPQLNRHIAEITANSYQRGVAPLPAIPRRRRREIIRLGYFSADLHSHAVAHLTAGLFEHHDRRQFEVVAFSFGPNRNDPMRERLLQAFDRFIDVSQRTDREVAQISRDLEIDIALDLSGYTRDARPGIFVRRAAPIQVNYMGIPGTMGADCRDYFIADPVVIPETSRIHYTEKIVYLPHNYLVNDRKRAPVAEAPSRAQLKLPAEAFVFCSFNSPYKIMPATFGAWMRILKRTPASVLWLYSDNPRTTANLRKEAAKRGVEGERLLIATPLPQAQHLARQPAADLMLDTFPCGAHTTASDALWAGLPVLTRQGESFQSRVAASLLQAADLAELVTTDEDQYEALAVALATDPARLGALTERLRANRLTVPLFNTEQYTRQLEEAYRQMYDRYHAGLMPEDIRIPA